MAETPKAGDLITVDDVEMIIDAIQKRAENFPDEPRNMTIALVLFNIGDRFAPVECIEGEWEGLKSDISKGDGVPTCPNGHPMVQGAGLKLGWLSEVSTR